MASAVSNAGALGIITGLTQPSPKDLANEIAKCHDMTDKPFGVNLTFLPGFANPDYPGYIDSIVKGGVKIVETAGRSPEKFMPLLKDAGIKVIHKCTSVRHSLKAEKIGCDAVKIEGGVKVKNIVRHLVKNNIPVLGHIGITPQTVKGKFTTKGKSEIEKKKIDKGCKSSRSKWCFWNCFRMYL